MGVDGVSEDTERSDRDRANAQLLDEYEGTGITHAALAEKHGVHVNTIRNRLNRSRMERDRRDARERMRR
jgi:lambda repressor-like predicted transcriptional regulator